MIEPKSDQDRFTAERMLRTRPKTYRAIVKLLADPDAKVLQIAKLHRVSEHTVRAIKAREAVAIAERKQQLISIFGNVAEIAAERMEELASKASLRDAGTTAGIATDKLLALSGDSSLTQTQQHLHLHLESEDIARKFNELLAGSVKQVMAARGLNAPNILRNGDLSGDGPSPALIDKTTGQRESRGA